MSDDGYTRITLRIPDGLHSKLTAEAARTSKSMNAEIVARLEASFSRPPREIIEDPEFREKVIDLIVPMVAEIHSQTLAAQKELALAGLSRAQIDAALEAEPTKAKLDRWAEPKVRPEQPQYPKPKKHK